MDNIQKSIDYMREKSADIKDKVCFLDNSNEIYRISMEVAGYYDNAVSALETMNKSKKEEQPKEEKPYMTREDIADVLYTVIMGLACPFALLVAPPPFSQKDKDKNNTED